MTTASAARDCKAARPARSDDATPSFQRGLTTTQFVPTRAARRIRGMSAPTTATTGEQPPYPSVSAQRCTSVDPLNSTAAFAPPKRRPPPAARTRPATVKTPAPNGWPRRSPAADARCPRAGGDLGQDRNRSLGGRSRTQAQPDWRPQSCEILLSDAAVEQPSHPILLAPTAAHDADVGRRRLQRVALAAARRTCCWTASAKKRVQARRVATVSSLLPDQRVTGALPA